MDPLIYTLLPFYYFFKIIFFPLHMMVGGGTSGTSDPSWTLEQAFAQIQQLLGTVNNLQQTIVQQEQTITQLQVQSMVTPLVQGQVAHGPKMAMPPFETPGVVTPSNPQRSRFNP
ncbi:hypothetical protein AMATHDRAFT_10841 [Amanita thiersii Skay4041]|uniref:Uncharacterized protein n=1 Tax=Amanita thiersii Skay4041 TaxID=703135 RepID=A0A2A9N6L5_9AGAR|nr:hypothetical protein AMATHDRAFT_10841 [Amanita thiersii Skay4041]